MSWRIQFSQWLISGYLQQNELNRIWLERHNSVTASNISLWNCSENQDFQGESEQSRAPVISNSLAHFDFTKE
jgi:hypothetical protein